MAPLSPRRSSRARTVNSQSQQSSASSATSGRPERGTRAATKPSSGKSTPSASLSSEPLDDLDDSYSSRRRKRTQDTEPDDLSRVKNPEMVNGTDLHEEDEAVRCLCGSEDYPGRPPVDGPDAELFDAVEFTEDVTGFFVQCDICKVWQHGACVGIFSAESSPDEYFCEKCRKDFHKIHTARNGQNYSKYLPLYRAPRSGSRATSISKDSARSPKNGYPNTPRPNAAAQTVKRRSTMNSRDAAYDDELLQRVIEASKEDVVHEPVENSSKKTKRGRSDSEEDATTVKRQRTGSRSVSPSREPDESNGGTVSDDEAGSTRNGGKKSREARSQREKSDREEKDRLRQEISNKRKGRTERRRAEDSDLSEEMPLAASKVAHQRKTTEVTGTDEVSSQAQVPGTPPNSQPTTASSHKRGAKNSQKRVKGKNQYTKERDAEHDESPARSMSRDIQRSADDTTGSYKLSMGDHRQGSKGKQVAMTKLSMLDMRRRVAAIMDFISRTQVDLAAEDSLMSQNGSSKRSSRDGVQDDEGTGRGDGDAASKSEAGTAADGSPVDAGTKSFEDLNCLEMMDVLTRDMVKWQKQYA